MILFSFLAAIMIPIICFFIIVAAAWFLLQVAKDEDEEK
jgi:hypothetical protein